jgi:hypothetical protein
MIEAGAGGDVIAVVAMLMPMNGTPSRAERRGHVRDGRAGEGLSTKGLFKMGALMKSSLRMGLLTKGVLKMGELNDVHGGQLAEDGARDDRHPEDDACADRLVQNDVRAEAARRSS